MSPWPPPAACTCSRKGRRGLSPKTPCTGTGFGNRPPMVVSPKKLSLMRNLRQALRREPEGGGKLRVPSQACPDSKAACGWRWNIRLQMFPSDSRAARRPRCRTEACRAPAPAALSAHFPASMQILRRKSKGESGRPVLAFTESASPLRFQPCALLRCAPALPDNGPRRQVRRWKHPSKRPFRAGC